MPLLNLQIIENVFTPEEKKQLITRLTDVIVATKGEAIRNVTWVKIDEIKEGQWGFGGQTPHAREIHQMLKPGA